MLHPMLNIAVQAARGAGKIIVRFLDHLEANDITEKSRHNFVTQADKLAEREIIHTLRRHYPEHGILAEESGADAGENPRFTWIIDPLDGTTNFIRGIPHFAVSIGLLMDKRLEVAVVYDPIKDELFTAARGKGAQLNNRRIRCNNTSKLDNALLGTGFPCPTMQHLPHYLKTFEAVFPACAGVRRMGSAALDLAYVACGRLDAYWEMDLKSWDIAAGALIVLESGGMVTDLQGQEGYLESGHILASTMKLHKPLLDLLPTFPSV